VLAGKARVLGVLTDRRRAHRDPAAERAQQRVTGIDCIRAEARDLVHRVDVEAEAFRHRQTVTQTTGRGSRPCPRSGSRRPLRAAEPVESQQAHESLGAVHFDTRAVRDRARRAQRADHRGMPYSRATIAACDNWPPRSVTIAPSSGSTTLNPAEVAV
jgi:hypothetical protein